MNDKALSDHQIEEALEPLNVTWSHIPGEGLVGVFETKNFAEGLALVNRIGEIAEQQDHHPELLLRPDEVEVTTVTHDAGGVTSRDIELAKAIDELVR